MRDRLRLSSITLVFVVTVVARVGHGQGEDFCSRQVEAVSKPALSKAKLRRLEQSLFTDLHEKLELAHQKPIALSAGVFQIEVAGTLAVLRVELGHDLALEHFAAELFSLAPTTLSARTQIIQLDPAAMQIVLGWLNKENNTSLDEARQNHSLRVSITPYIHATTGETYLNQNYGRRFRYRLVSAIHASHEGHPVENSIRSLENLWRALPARAQRSVIKDLQPHLPRQITNDDPDFIKLLLACPPSRALLMDFGNWNLFSTRIADHLPPHLMAQLADQWALYALMGFFDFHAGNWLVSEAGGGEPDIIIGIDLANAEVGREMELGLSLLLESSDPLGYGNLEIGLLRRLKTSLTPELRNFLKTLNAETLFELAQNLKYPLSAADVTGVLQRARWLLE